VSSHCQPGQGVATAPGGDRATWAAAARAALVPYAAVRAALLLLAFVGAWTTSRTVVNAPSDYLARWDRWDVVLLRRIAHFGYGGDPSLPPDPGLPSFFPGYPLLLRAVHVVVPSWVLAGLVVSVVAGAVAAVALVRVAQLDGLGTAVGGRAVLYLFTAPYAVFLVAGYTEAVFLALALPAWIAARQDRWTAAGLLAGAAASVRITGLFLGVALVVQYAVAVRRLRWSMLPLLAPFAVVAAYMAYLHARTGDWLAWTHAQERGFSRRFTWPWDALRTTLDAGASAAQGAEYRFSFYAETCFAALGVALVVLLLRRRRWAEATYVGLAVCALVSSTFFFSVSRASLVWWPLPLLLATAAAQRSWLHAVYLAVSLPLLAALTLTFTSGAWTA
jgi:hypothetical protein